jgi:hypothetical protein
MAHRHKLKIIWQKIGWQTAKLQFFITRSNVNADELNKDKFEINDSRNY